MQVLLLVESKSRQKEKRVNLHLFNLNFMLSCTACVHFSTGIAFANESDETSIHFNPDEKERRIRQMMAMHTDNRNTFRNNKCCLNNHHTESIDSTSVWNRKFPLDSTTVHRRQLEVCCQRIFSVGVQDCIFSLNVDPEKKTQHANVCSIHSQRTF